MALKSFKTLTIFIVCWMYNVIGSILDVRVI